MKDKFITEIKESRRRLIIAAIALLIILIFSGLIYATIDVCTKSNDSLIETELSKIVYTDDVAEEELTKLQNLEKLQPLSLTTKGCLYKAMAELSYMAADDMTYNRYIAYAVFYLDKSGDQDSIAYLTNKYIGRLYANGSYESALHVLGELADDCEMNNFAPQIQASYYLSLADVEQMLDHDSTNNLTKAQDAILQSPEGGDRLLNQAKHDLLTTRSLMMKNDFDAAEKILQSYSDKDDFGLGERQVYVVCDFKLPYYELMAKLYLNNGDKDDAYRMVQKYVAICEHYQFRTMKLNLLTYMTNKVQPDNDLENNPYSAMEKEAIVANLDEMSNEYGQLLLNDIDNKKAELAELEQNMTRIINRSKLAVLVLCLAILSLCLITILVDMTGKDGLTGLYNRKRYEHKIREFEKRKIPYCLMILDIDNFKLVNDRYGHAKGDIVLSSISQILLRYINRWTLAYRYGGEELCMVFIHITEARVREIGEEIRRTIENRAGDSEIKVTVSGGIGISKKGENIFLDADKKLYESKANGKNQIN